MNPWSRAESGDERVERELFVRRARAVGPMKPPSLSAVLRAAEKTAVPRGPRGSRASSFATFVLAAACFAAVWHRLPSFVATDAITPEEGAESSRALRKDSPLMSMATMASIAPRSSMGSMSRADEGDACSSSMSGGAPRELPACFIQPASFTPMMSRSVMACERDESCGVAGP